MKMKRGKEEVSGIFKSAGIFLILTFFILVLSSSLISAVAPTWDYTSCSLPNCYKWNEVNGPQESCTADCTSLCGTDDPERTNCVFSLIANICFCSFTSCPPLNHLGCFNNDQYWYSASPCNKPTIISQDCGTSTDWTSCGYTSTCDESAPDKTRTLRGCTNNQCYNNQESQTCTRDTDGDSCGRVSCTANNTVGYCVKKCSSQSCVACTPTACYCAVGWNNTDGDMANGCEAPATYFQSNLDLNLNHMWTMDSLHGSDSKNAVDIISNHNLTVNKQTSIIPGKKSQAYTFDGVDDNLGSNSYPKINIKSNFTVCFWLSAKSVKNINIFLLSYRNASDKRINIIINYSRAIVGDIYDSSIKAVAATSPISLNSWYHVCYVKTGANTAKIYLNGTDNTKPGAGASGTSTSGLRIAAKTDESQTFNGSIDEVGIWSRALNASEILQLYNYYFTTTPEPPPEDTTRNTACNGLLPENASWNDGNNNGKFVQTLVEDGWSPEEKNATFNTTTGECNFICQTNYIWNPSSKACDAAISAPAVQYCRDYNINQCSNYNPLTAKNSVLNLSACSDVKTVYMNGKTCYNYTKCICTWRNNECKPGLDSNIISCDGTVENGPEPECYWDVSIEDKCDSEENKIIAHYVSKLPGCPAQGDRTYECVSTNQLGFFDNISFIASLLLISLVYAVIVMRRK